jgi:hypothetical protein
MGPVRAVASVGSPAFYTSPPTPLRVLEPSLQW